jgi:pilus assembly protein CpaC
MVNTLAEPNLTAISGENARFLAGGEFPVPSGIDQNGNIVYEYRPFGVSLAFRPIVLSNDRISLQVSTEVSEISSDQSLQLQNVTIPSFNVRRAETTIELGSGGSLMLAGLIESQTIRTLNEVPGLRKIPVIGQLISSESFQRNESELIIMMTAYTVKPFAENKDVKNDYQSQNTIQNIYSESNPLNDILHYHLEKSEGVKEAHFDNANEKIKKTGYIIE